MKVVCAPLIFRGLGRLRRCARDQAAAGPKPYDFVVHVKNSAEIRYDPKVSSDRAGMAVALVKRYCHAPRVVVGQEKIISEIYWNNEQ